MSRPGGYGGPPQQPPLSFKTVPGRNRTQKWNQAKTYNYDGDDWGGFDAYDEYGGGPDDEVPPPQHQYGPPQAGIARQQSFEQGSERRQFSAPVYPHPADRRPSPAMSGSSGAGSDYGRQRQYSNPGQQPPVQSRGPSQGPPVIARKASNTSIDNPPRPSSSGSKSDKPLPFIRPSDIYKRMAEEKEKERLSMESSRPSMESLQREGTPNSAQRPLSTVQERPGSADISTILAAHSPAAPEPVDTTAPRLTEHQSTIVPPPTAVHDTEGQHSLQSIVQDAFHRDDRSTTASDVTRSNTDSTSSISPIISRIPSTVNADQRAQPRDFPVYPIQEEPARSQHSRNVSAETMTPSTYQNLDSAMKSDAITPSEPASRSAVRRDSPARTPAIGNVEGRRLSGPMAAESAEAPPHPAFDEFKEQKASGRPRAGTDYSLREADLAREASVAHPNTQPEIGQAQQQIQDSFLTERSPEVAEAPQLRREWSFDASPGLEDIRPKKEELSVPTRPTPAHADSFRPQLPGGWVSAAPTPAIEKSAPILPVLNPPSPLHTGRTSAQQSPAVEREDIDFTPTSSTSAVRQTPSSNQVRDAGAALGAAFLSSHGASHHTQDFATPRDAPQPDIISAQQRGPSGDVYARHPLHRELSSAPSESNASVMSDVPPTPPVKDYNHTVAKPADLGLPSGSFVNTDTPLEQEADEDGWTGNSPGSSVNEYESDRLRRDIVKSLDLSNNPAAKSAHLGNTTIDESTVSPLESNHSQMKSAQLVDQPATTTTRPGLLDQRFSWESQLPAPAPAPEPLAAPKMPIAVVGELPDDKGRLSYERPADGKPLHVTNAPKEELRSPVVSPITNDSIDTPLTAIPSHTDNLEVPSSINRNELSPSPVSMGESSHIPSYYAGITDEQIGKSDPSPNDSPQLPQTAVSSEVSNAAAAPQTKQDRQPGRIPPFREILAMKTPPERIKAYTETRYTFADMDTGLGDWLTTVFAQHPEHEGLKSANRVSYDESSYPRGHRTNPSLFKMKQFDNNVVKSSPNTSRMSDVPPATPPKDFNMEKMQAKGKDIMKSAGVLGGKAQAGAKGLLAKGRSRFARTGEKDA